VQVTTFPSFALNNCSLRFHAKFPTRIGLGNHLESKMESSGALDSTGRDIGSPGLDKAREFKREIIASPTWTSGAMDSTIPRLPLSALATDPAAFVRSMTETGFVVLTDMGEGEKLHCDMMADFAAFVAGSNESKKLASSSKVCDYLTCCYGCMCVCI